MAPKSLQWIKRKLLSCVGRKDNNTAPGYLRKSLVIVGDGWCGKTSILVRMATGEFVGQEYQPTTFETQVIDVFNTGKEHVKLMIFDTAGQEEYARLRPLSYNDVDVALICFALDTPDSLVNVVENWAPEIRHFCGNIPVILVGNKKDLRDQEPSVSSSSSGKSHESHSVDKTPLLQAPSDSLHQQKTKRANTNTPIEHSEGLRTAKNIGALAYYETSAVTGENVETLLLASTKAAVLGKKKSQKFKPFKDTLKCVS